MTRTINQMQIFENTEIAFKLRNDRELRKAVMLLRLMSYPAVVRLSGILANLAIRLGIPVRWIVKPTVFSLFCGGESLVESQKVVDRLAKHKVRSLLDYAAEDQQTDEKIESAIREIIATMDYAVKNPAVPFTVFKPTALAPVHILSQTGLQTEEGKLSCPGTEKFSKNFRTLCQSACKRGIPVMIDAEESHYQQIVDNLAAEMMELYNKEKVMIFNTIQMYRHDRLDFLKESIRNARKKNYHLGIKLVRGAYMEKERERALKLGYPSPIHPDKESTDNAFNRAITICLENIDITDLFAGTHNEQSLLMLMDRMKEYKLENSDPRIYVSQLYGMSDHISFNMAACNYNVAKYLPYGPVSYLLPYLIRRAEENRSVTGQAGRERRLLKLEIERRKQFKNKKV